MGLRVCQKARVFSKLFLLGNKDPFLHTHRDTQKRKSPYSPQLSFIRAMMLIKDRTEAGFPLP